MEATHTAVSSDPLSNPPAEASKLQRADVELGVLVCVLDGVPVLELLAVPVCVLEAVPVLELLGVPVLELEAVPVLELLGVPVCVFEAVPVLELLAVPVCELEPVPVGVRNAEASIWAVEKLTKLLPLGSAMPAAARASRKPSCATASEKACAPSDVASAASWSLSAAEASWPPSLEDDTKFRTTVNVEPCSARGTDAARRLDDTASHMPANPKSALTASGKTTKLPAALV